MCRRLATPSLSHPELKTELALEASSFLCELIPFELLSRLARSSRDQLARLRADCVGVFSKAAAAATSAIKDDSRAVRDNNFTTNA